MRKSGCFKRKHPDIFLSYIWKMLPNTTEFS